MIPRLLATSVFMLGAALLLGGLVLLGRAPGLPAVTRHLRQMKDRVAPPTTWRDFTMTDFAALPHGAPLAERIRLERLGVRMEGWVQRMLLSGDGDLHLELAEVSRGPGERDTMYIVAEVTPQWRRRLRGWSYDSLLTALRPNRGGPTGWESGPRRVRLSGWLNYDHPYDKPVTSWMLLHQSARRTGWEIHPVTGIELWNDDAGRWQELAR